MPALKVNIIIVHLRGVVFPRALAPRENNIPRVNNYDVHRKCRHLLFYYTETRCKKILINANISVNEQPEWFHWANRWWPFYTYLYHVHVLDHGHFTDIVSALAI